MLLNSFIFLSFVVYSVQAFRALYFTSNVGYSHLEYTGRLADILVNAGHEVDYVINVWDPQRKHNGSRKANVIRYEGRSVEKIGELSQQMHICQDSFSKDMSSQDWFVFGQIFALQCEDLLSDYKFLGYLRSRNYTVGLAEDYDGCALAIFRMLGIKSRHETSAFALPDLTAMAHGIPIDFRHIPVFHTHKQSDPIGSFVGSLYNLYSYLISRFQTQQLYYGQTDEVIQRLLGSVHPTIAEMRRQTSYIWVNSFEFADFPRLSSPKIKHIGGITIQEPPTMNEDMQQIFNRAKTGVVLISFGSLVNTVHMKPDMRRQLMETFASLPDYEFVWRLTELNDEILADVRNYSNVHVFKWLQQTAILAHPKTSAFVSHVGMNSLNEAVHFGIPLVAVPFFGDQRLNAAMAVKRGNGIFVSRQNLPMIRSALHEILHNKKYRERAQDLKAKIANMPLKSDELFIKHVEFAERFDMAKDLELDSADETLLEQFNLDIIGLGLLFAFLLVFLVYKILYGGFVTASRLLGRGELNRKKVD